MPRPGVPRSGWLAAGAIVGAVVATGWSLPVAVLVVAGNRSACDAGLRRPWLTWAALATAAVLLRAAIGVIAAPIEPVSAGPVGGADAWEHEAVVLSVNAPSAGQQRAVLELRPPDAAEPGLGDSPRISADRARGHGVASAASLEPAPTDSGFGEFLARSGIGFTTRARALERIGDDGSPLAELEQVRRGAASAISMALPEPQAGLAAAMSIGLRDVVPRDVSNDVPDQRSEPRRRHQRLAHRDARRGSRRRARGHRPPTANARSSWRPSLPIRCSRAPRRASFAPPSWHRSSCWRASPDEAGRPPQASR